MFLFLSALACLLALVFVLVPLLRAAPAARDIRRRLDALDALQGDLPADEWQRRRSALQAELDAAPRSNDHRLTAALVVLLVPVLVVLLTCPVCWQLIPLFQCLVCRFQANS